MTGLSCNDLPAHAKSAQQSAGKRTKIAIDSGNQNDQYMSVSQAPNNGRSKMVKNSKQYWRVGATVKVGFLSLVVKAAIATPGDYLPDAYILADQAGTQLYRFVPHNGLKKIDVAEAKEMIEQSERNAAKAAEKAIAKAAAGREIDALFSRR